MGTVRKGGPKVSHELFIEKVKNICGDEYSVTSKYAGVNRDINIVHNACGYVQTRKAKGFIESIRRKSKCIKCEGLLIDTNSFKKRITEKYGIEYSVIGEYVSAHKKILMKHNACENEWLVTPNNIFRGYGCPKCYGIVKKDTKQFNEEVFKIVESEYQVVGEYQGSRSPLTMKHMVCGNMYETSPDNFLRGKRCPNCYHSKGESLIKDFLVKHKIDFKNEYTFEDCKNVKKLRFDFALFKKDALICLVEYDGIQHFKPTFGLHSFEITQINDRIKNDYCLKNGIQLIRIPYTDYEDIENILEEELDLIVKT